LVYQLKRATEQVPGFTLPRRPRYLLVDEYQDLNRCDLAVVRATCDQGAELFAAGDDDQSIYGFRHAFPLGIRRFDDDYPLATHLELSECYRCQSPILDFAQFVADLDIRRLQKSTHSACASAPSEVRLLAFPNETAEAAAVARICQHLLSAHGILPGEVLILLRSDHNQAFSSVLAQAIRDRNLPVSVRLVPERPTDHDSGRILLAFMRLATSTEESLSWRTLIKLRNNGIGDETIERLHEIAYQQHRNLYAILQMVKRSPDILGSSGGRVAAEVVSIETALNEVGRPPDTGEVPPVVEWVARLGKLVLTDLAEQERIAGFLGDVIAGTDCSSIPRLLGVLSLPDETIEQETDPDAINIMTMHKAKGLSAEVVFVVGAEDEYVPGRNVEGPLMLDELRLLYVSLTRTRNRLYVTYCGQRRGQQMRTGRTPSTPRRTLTRFLQDGPIHAENGIEFASTLPT
jgi:DNA helicase-2/ATP-dependent DNA helicase PcrA